MRPVSFESVFSFFNLIPSEPVRQTYTAPTVVPHTITTAPQVIPYTGTVTYSPAPTVTEAMDSTAVFALIWIAGIAAMVAYAIFSWARLTRSLDTAVRDEGNVWLSDRVRSPFIMGYVNPKIYLPFGLKNEEREYVLAHERHHLRRGDHFVKLFSFGLLTLHWFNPMVWLAFLLMSRDMEMSCDEYVLGRHENIASRYSMTLLSFASNRRFPAPSPLAFGESDVKPRIRNALSWKKPSVWLCVLLALVCVGLIVGCVSDPVTDSGGETAEDPATESILYFNGGQIVAEADSVSPHPETIDGYRCIVLDGDHLAVFDRDVICEDGRYVPVDTDSDPQVIYSGDHYTTENISRSDLIRRLTAMRFYEDGEESFYSPAVPTGEFQLRRYYDPEHSGETLLTLYIRNGIPIWLSNPEGTLIMELIPTGDSAGTPASPERTPTADILYYRGGDTVAEAESVEAHQKAIEEYRFVTLEGDELGVFTDDLIVVNGLLVPLNSAGSDIILYRGSTYTSEFLSRSELSQQLKGMRFYSGGMESNTPLPTQDGVYEIRRYFASDSPDHILLILYLCDGEPLWLGTPDGQRIIELTMPLDYSVTNYYAEEDHLVCELETDSGTKQFQLALADLAEDSPYLAADHYNYECGQATFGFPFKTGSGTVNITNNCTSTAIVGIYWDPGCYIPMTETTLSPGEGACILELQADQVYFLRFSTPYGKAAGGITVFDSVNDVETDGYDLTTLDGLDVEVPENVATVLVPVISDSTVITVHNNSDTDVNAALWRDNRMVIQTAEPILIPPGETGTLTGSLPSTICYLEVTSPTAERVVVVIDDGPQ